MASAEPPLRVIVSGATGYLGRPLVARLLERGHRVLCLTRPGSLDCAPGPAVAVDPFDPDSLAPHVRGADAFVQLVGVPHPAPWKERQFRDVDLASLKAALAACAGTVRHFVYVSVAQPAPVMAAFVRVRAEGEALIRASGLPATLLRPWYVLGPGHRWPLALVPCYRLLEAIPATREAARRLGLVTLAQMTAALAAAVERPPNGVRIVAVPEIRGAA